MFKPVSAKFVRYIIGPKAFGDNPYPKEQTQAVLNELQQQILPTLENHLSKKCVDDENQSLFFCGESLTIVDIQYYNELMQLSSLDTGSISIS